MRDPARYVPAQVRRTPWAPARGEQGGQAPTLEKITVGMAHPGNFSRGLKTSWQQFVNESIMVYNLCALVVQCC